MKTILASAQQVHNLALFATAFAVPARQSLATSLAFAFLTFVLTVGFVFTQSAAVFAQPTTIAPPANVQPAKIKVSKNIITLPFGVVSETIPVTVEHDEPGSVTLIPRNLNPNLLSVAVLPGNAPNQRLIQLNFVPGNYGATSILFTVLTPNTSQVATSAGAMTVAVQAPPANPFGENISGFASAKARFLSRIPGVIFPTLPAAQTSHAVLFQAYPAVPALRVQNPSAPVAATDSAAKYLRYSLEYKDITVFGPNNTPSKTSLLDQQNSEVRFWNNNFILRFIPKHSITGICEVTLTIAYGAGDPAFTTSQTFRVQVTNDLMQNLTLSPIGNVAAQLYQSGVSFGSSPQFTTNFQPAQFFIVHNNPKLLDSISISSMASGTQHRVWARSRPYKHGQASVTVVAYDGVFNVQLSTLTVDFPAQGQESEGQGGGAELGEGEETAANGANSGVQSKRGKELKGLDAPAHLPSKETVSMKAYPNPASHKATVEYALPAADEARVELFTAQGVKLQTLSAGRREAGVHSAEADLSGLQSGSYILRVFSGRYGVSSRAITVTR